MKNKKIFIGIICALILILIVFIIIKVLTKTDEETTTEITPMQEMTEDQERQTIVSLYYINTETKSLMPEAKVIDAKDLLKAPYETLIEYLKQTPNHSKLKCSIQDNVKINKVELIDNVLLVDLSKEFIEDKDELNLRIYSIVNTLTELNEINSVKILIDGEENKKIEGTDIDFSQNFTRQST